MFATVEFYEGEKSLTKRLRRLFVREKITVERVNLPENEYFYKLKVPVHKGRMPAEGLKKISRSLSDGLIFPKDLKNEFGIKAYTSAYFKDMLVFNSAVSLIEKSISNPVDTVITLIDKKGFLNTEINRLVPFTGELKIITDNIRAYEGTTRRIMEEYGLSIMVSDRLSSIPEKGIIISRHSDVIPVYFKGLLITGEKRLLPFARVLTGEGIKSRGDYSSLCPEGIDMTDFLSALCEVCFVRELRESEYEKLVDISL